jgi:hypothetical protein
VSPFQWFVAALCGWIKREPHEVVAYLQEENRVLRAHLRGRRLRLSDQERRRLAVLGHQLGRATLTHVATIATADTILRWHRELTVRRCVHAQGQSGRPRVQARVRILIVRMVTENPTWGYTRIQGALKNVGHSVGRSSIARILREQGIPPSGQRPMAWGTFVRAHWPALLAADLFASVTGILRGWVTQHTPYITDLHTRRTSVHLNVAPGQRLSASSHVAVDEQVHGVLAITQPDSSSAFDVPRWSQPAGGISGCPRGPDSRPHNERPRFYTPVRPVDEGGGPESRRVTWGAQSPAGTRGTGGAVPWRARSPTAPVRVDRMSAHTASGSSGVASLAASAIVSSYDRSAA